MMTRFPLSPRALLGGLALLGLAACAPAPSMDRTPEVASRAVGGPQLSALPPMKVFGAGRGAPVERGNAEIARDILDLSFALESGRRLPVLTRFEGPITLRVTGRPGATLPGDLARLITRLRGEAGIALRQVPADRAANITIEAIPRAEIRRQVAQAACFVAPGVSSLAEYRRARRGAATDWTALTTRKRIAIFLPSDSSPQEVRDCLHEELAQALGPLNDLYRLTDSVFNDDNVHTVLTGFDMLVLRALYHPSLRSGMTRAQVAARLPGILNAINPAGRAIPIRAAARPVPRDWIDAVQTAMGPGAPMGQRIAAANAAVRLSQIGNMGRAERAFSWFALGRLTLGRDPARSRDAFLAADRLYADAPELRLHRAYVATQLAAFTLAAGDGSGTLALVEPYIATAHAHENAALLSTLMMLRAEALLLTGRGADAGAVRLDSLGWARYGFGDDRAVVARLREIAALSPL